MSQSYFSAGRQFGGYGGLERMTQNYSPGIAYAAAASIPQIVYDPINLVTPSSHSNKIYNTQPEEITYQQKNIVYQLFPTKPEYDFIPNTFLKPGKHGSFVGKAEEIREYVEDVFQKMLNKEFPADIKISVLEEAAFHKIAPSPEVIGLSINRTKQGLLSEIFVKNDYLARIMLTVGHELGHVLTPTLDNAQDEEAKAYAFSLAWMKVIKEHDIAGLGDAIIFENPANNGLHDVAYNFVLKMMRDGQDCWKVYLDLIMKNLMVQAVA